MRINTTAAIVGRMKGRADPSTVLAARVSIAFHSLVATEFTIGAPFSQALSTFPYHLFPTCVGGRGSDEAIGAPTSAWATSSRRRRHPCWLSVA